MRAFRGGWTILILQACAVISSPSGGPPDTHPPQLLQTHIDTSSHSIRLQFDEYIATTSSPWVLNPGGIRVLPKVRGNTLHIQYPDSLRPDPGFVLSVTEGVKDLTEGNILPQLSIWIATDSTQHPPRGSLSLHLQRFGTSTPSSKARIELFTSQGTFITWANTRGEAFFHYLPSGPSTLIAYEESLVNQRPDPFEWQLYDTIRILDSLHTSIIRWLHRPPQCRISAIRPLHFMLWEIQFEGQPSNIKITSPIDPNHWTTAHPSPTTLWLWIDSTVPLPATLHLQWADGDSTIRLLSRAASRPSSPIHNIEWDPFHPHRLKALVVYPIKGSNVPTPFTHADIPCDSLHEGFPVSIWHSDRPFIWIDTPISGLTCWRFPRNIFRWAPLNQNTCFCAPVPPAPIQATFELHTEEDGRYRLQISDTQMFHVEHPIAPHTPLTLWLAPGTYHAWVYQDDAPTNQWYDPGSPETQHPAEQLISYQKIQLSSRFHATTILLNQHNTHHPNNKRK